MTRVVSISISEREHEKLQDLMEEFGETRHAVIKRAIRSFVDEGKVKRGNRSTMVRRDSNPGVLVISNDEPRFSVRPDSDEEKAEARRVKEKKALAESLGFVKTVH